MFPSRVNLSRRTVLAGLAGLGVTAWFASKSAIFRSPGGWLVGADGRKFVLIGLADKSVVEILTPTQAHGFAVWPHAPACFIGVEKSGNLLSLVDFQNRRVLQNIFSPEPRSFYGHVAIRCDALLSSQVDRETGLGYLVVYDSKTLQVKDEHQMTVGGIHEMAFLPGEPDVVVCTSSGVRHLYQQLGSLPTSGVRIEKSSLIYFDLSKRKIVEKQFLDDESMICGHLRPFTNGRVAMISTLFDQYAGSEKTKSGSLYLSSRGQPLREIAVPADVRAKMDYELLSVAVDLRNHEIAATNPRGRQILVFDGRNETFVRAVTSSSNGVAIDPEMNAVYYSSMENEKRIDQDRFVDVTPLHALTSAHFIHVENLKA